MGRKLSWQVHAPPGAGAAMLEAMQGCLQQAGLQCAVDAAAYSIQASYSPSTQELAAAAEAEAEGQPGSGGAPMAAVPTLLPGRGPGSWSCTSSCSTRASSC